MENQLATTTKAQITAFKNIVEGSYYQNQMKSLFGKNAGTFATSMMELYTSSKELQQCEPKLVAAEAMRAAALHLPLSKQLGRAYVVVFKDHGVPKPQFIIGWRGLIDLAVRTGQYETINAVCVYKGELVGQDKMSGFMDISGERESDEIVGYLAFFKLTAGFKKMVYMDLKSMCHFAKTYVPTLKFSKETEETLFNLAQAQSHNGPQAGKIGWFGDFNAMALKTVVRQVLKWGPMSIEVEQAINEDPDYESPEVARDIENAEASEVIDAKEVLQQEQPAEEEKAPF